VIYLLSGASVIISQGLRDSFCSRHGHL